MAEPDLPDLSIRPLVAETRRQWTENPLPRRIWRQIRPWALAFALVQMLQQGIGLLAQYVNTAGTGGTFNAAWIATVGGSCLFGLLHLVLWVLAPVWFTKWARKKYWRDDPNLSAAPLPKRDRFLGIAVPALIAVFVFYIPSFIFVPFTMILTFTDPQIAGLFGGHGSLSTAFLGVSSLSQVVVSVWSYMLLFVTVILRVLLFDSMTGLGNNRRWSSAVMPYVVNLLLSFVWGFLRSMPMIIVAMTGAFAMGLGGAASTSDFMWLGVYSFSMLIDCVFFVLSFRVMRYFWKRDIPLARTSLFLAEE